MKIKLEDGTKILFTGDSITDCNRAHPVGMGSGLGSGYVSFVDSILASCNPEKQIKVINTGVSGDRVTDLEARWQSDVKNLNPDWLSIMIGINDVWSQFDDLPRAHQVTIDLYENTYRKLLEETRDALDGLVLMTPYFLELDKQNPMRKQMDVYGEVVKSLAEEFDAVFIDIQDAFDNHMKIRPKQPLADDKVHPENIGHMIIAQTFLKYVS